MQQKPIALRRLPLQGACNVRDLGGYACEGGSTRWHAFLRSDGPNRLTDADIDLLAAYGVTDAIDLRSAHEAEESPSRLALSGKFSAHNVPMMDGIMSGGREMPPTLGELYLALLDYGAADFARVFRIMAKAEGGVLFHCAVGKDRTGVTAMLLLGLAGVSDADIVADYAVSEIYLYEMMKGQLHELEKRNIPASLLRSEAANMHKALNHLHEKYGTAEDYLRGAGLTEAELGAVKQKLVLPIGATKQ